MFKEAKQNKTKTKSEQTFPLRSSFGYFLANQSTASQDTELDSILNSLFSISVYFLMVILKEWICDIDLIVVGLMILSIFFSPWNNSC